MEVVLRKKARFSLCAGRNFGLAVGKCSFCIEYRPPSRISLSNFQIRFLGMTACNSSPCTNQRVGKSKILIDTGLLPARQQ
ncbi:hypothetical protein C5167_030934 [Papaver somniferum]|nr:hypothetical protein C5167_030934 [Papaver somniferum]